jgi:ATP-binding cassette subfamily F protein uup
VQEASPRAPARDKPRAKLSYKETRELEALPAEIEALEVEQKALEEKTSAPDYFKAGSEAMRTDSKRAEQIERALLAKLERWEALEGKARPAPS